jgi:hypothetical protein
VTAPAAPRPRTPAQIEASRRNGARSRGPVTAEGKARSSRNALKHGLAAAEHLLLEGEDTGAYEELVTNLVEEVTPEREIEAQLTRRLAATFWKQARADRLEQKLFDAAERPRLLTPDGYVEADPEATFDLARFNAVRHYQAALARESLRILRTLKELRRNPLVASEPAYDVEENEPEPAPEPRREDEASPPACPEVVANRNEPERPAASPWLKPLQEPRLMAAASSNEAWAGHGRQRQQGDPGRQSRP